MTASLEARRRAVVDALRRVAADAESSPTTTMDHRLDELAVRIAAVETVLLEAAWDRPALPSTGPSAEDDGLDRVAVPALPLSEGRMSSVAARALFGH